jgi:hypothetical protein
MQVEENKSQMEESPEDRESPQATSSMQEPVGVATGADDNRSPSDREDNSGDASQSSNGGEPMHGKYSSMVAAGTQ